MEKNGKQLYTEHYNKTYTSRKLEELFDRFLTNDNLPMITPEEIDSLLQNDTDGSSYTQDSCWDYLVRFYQEKLLLPELFAEDGNAWNSGDTDTRMKILQNEYQTGNYFHILSNEYAEAEEWLAINCNSQRTAAGFLSAILNETDDNDRPMKELLFSAKIYAANGGTNTPVNHEKMVLYYPGIFRKNIYRFVMKKLQGHTLPYLSPFCTLYTLQDKALYFGTGYDWGTYSFNQRCTLHIAEFLNEAPVTDWDNPVSLEKTRHRYLKRKQDFVTDCFNFVCNLLKDENLCLNKCIY